jgi:hypothetical protein
MKNEDNENLKDLLAKFFDAREASEVGEDILAGERIFASNPTPEPSPALLADIKRRMAISAATQKRFSVRPTAWEFAAAAAAIIVLALGGLTLFQKSGQTLQYIQASESFWQETPENALDARITQLEQPESGMLVITLESNVSQETTAIGEIADELNKIKGTFWEG